ncbi:MAG: thiamine biosynthesis protein ThiS [Spirulinaceae cyanobacterium SM2_1_0]|nr:thiamine biosynthesis protein ThiS [Spirulinaceae cyanobacterium SM2_1_0]
MLPVTDFPPEIVIQLNGQIVNCPPQQPLPDFLAQQQLNPRLIAIEYNGEILHRQYWATTQLAAGDRLEIVTIVGGG